MHTQSKQRTTTWGGIVGEREREKYMRRCRVGGGTPGFKVHYARRCGGDFNLQVEGRNTVERRERSGAMKEAKKVQEKGKNRSKNEGERTRHGVI